MERKTKFNRWHLLIMVLACIVIGVIGARAQSYQPAVDTATIYSLDKFEQLPYKPNLHPLYELDEITTSGPSIKYIDIGIKSVESHLGTSWISEYDKSSIIAYLVNLVAELMEPGETITIKKAKQ
ncbi:MAG: hypothetical protein IPN33_25085 [Saprospiraceae bacterium]|nr:hypothetical protein [Saprospiraceae bacterium]